MKVKCEICGYEKPEEEIIKEQVNPWGTKNYGTITVCENCSKIVYNYTKRINEIMGYNKKEANQA